MATGGVIGNGTKVGFSENSTSPVTYLNVGQLLNIDQFLQLVADDVDNTVMGTSNIMTSMPGMIPAPEFQFTLLSDHDPATSPRHETLRKYQSGSGDASAGSNLLFRVEVPTNRAKTLFRGWQFTAYVKQYSANTPIGDKQTTQITAKFAGGYSVDSGTGAGFIA